MTKQNPFAGADPVTLRQLLDSREARAEKQRALLQRHEGALISFTLNIPGAYKLYPLAVRTFDEGVRVVSRELESRHVPVAHHERVVAPTGCEGYLCVGANALVVKAMMMPIEDHHPLGRLFDIDVLDRRSGIVKGAALGRSPRSCFICGGPVWECSSRQAHPAEQLALRVTKMMEDFFFRQFADKVCREAVRALLYEVGVTPKPGLVDRANTGAHRDMDIFTFLDSSCALIPYFRDITLASIREIGEPDELPPRLRFVGRWAEGEMFLATKGVNTHKGLIFSMGVVCAALGYLYSQGTTITPDAVFATCAKMAGGTEKELEEGNFRNIANDVGTDEEGSNSSTGAKGNRPDSGGKNTYGQGAFNRHRLTGARGEAAAGFPHVRNVGLPVLRKYLGLGCSVNDAGAIALLHLIACVDDTNMVGRNGIEALRGVQAAVSGLTGNADTPAALLAAAHRLDGELTAKNLSPGGSADLLALTLLIHWVTQPDF